MKNRSLEQIFQEKLGELRIEPSEKAMQVFNKKLKKRGRIVLVRRLSIAASIILIGAIGIFYFIPDTEKDSLVQEINNPNEVEEIMEKTVPDRVNPEIQADEILSSEPSNSKKQDSFTENNDQDKSGTTIAKTVKSNQSESNDKIKIRTPFNPEKSMKSTDNLSNNKNNKNESSSELNKDFIYQTPDPSSLAALEIVEDRIPVKITIEYIASGSKNKNASDQKTKISELYSKMNNIVYPDEVMGDIRNFKDQLFALDFIKGNKSETQNRKQK